jgi:hypothetical protein
MMVDVRKVFDIFCLWERLVDINCGAGFSAVCVPETKETPAT